MKAGEGVACVLLPGVLLVVKAVQRPFVVFERYHG